MKIVFYNNSGGQTKTTSNLAAISTYIALHNQVNLLLFEGKCEKKSYLKEALMEQRTAERDMNESGMDVLARMIKSCPITSEMLNSCTINLFQNRLHLLLGSQQKDQDLYEADIAPLLTYCINAANESYDFVMIDAGTKTSLSGYEFLELADVIVVNLCQNQHLLSDTFPMNPSDVKKCFFIVGAYDTLSKYNLAYIKKRFKISDQRIGVIPYNVMFHDAFSDGSIVKFLAQIDQSTKDEMNYYLIQELSKTVEKLMKFAKQIQGQMDASSNKGVRKIRRFLK